MQCPTRCHLFVTCLLVLSFTACTPLPPPPATPAVTSPYASAKARRIQARTTGLRTLAAVLSVTFSAPSRRDTFDMIVNYDAAGKTRYTAFKDLLLGTQPIFDLLFIDAQYHLATHDAGHTRRHQGRMAHFAAEHPEMRVFALVGEAFFLPGYDARGRPPIVLNAAGTQFASQLKSGLKAVWSSRPNSPEIIRAQLDGELDATPLAFQLTYRDYRSVAAYDIPTRVTLSDPYMRFTTQALIKQIEINTPLAQGVFDLTAGHQPTRQRHHEDT